MRSKLDSCLLWGEGEVSTLLLGKSVAVFLAGDFAPDVSAQISACLSLLRIGEGCCGRFLSGCFLGKGLPTLRGLPNLVLRAPGGEHVALQDPSSTLRVGKRRQPSSCELCSRRFVVGSVERNFFKAFVLDARSREASIDVCLCGTSRRHRASFLDASLCATSRHGSRASRHFLSCNVEASTLPGGMCREIRPVLIVRPFSISRHFVVGSVETFFGGCVEDFFWKSQKSDDVTWGVLVALGTP